MGGQLGQLLHSSLHPAGCRHSGGRGSGSSSGSGSDSSSQQGDGKETSQLEHRGSTQRLLRAPMVPFLALPRAARTTCAQQHPHRPPLTATTAPTIAAADDHIVPGPQKLLSQGLAHALGGASDDNIEGGHDLLASSDGSHRQRDTTALLACAEVGGSR